MVQVWNVSSADLHVQGWGELWEKWTVEAKREMLYNFIPSEDQKTGKGEKTHRGGRWLVGLDDVAPEDRANEEVLHSRNWVTPVILKLCGAPQQT